MLQRTLEPEVMDTEEEAREYDSMDHSAVNHVFVRDFLAVHQSGWQVLDVGTGNARIPIELCRREPRALVVAIDLAGEMLRVAAANVAAAGLAWRIHLRAADAKELPFDGNQWGAVISNSIVHHSPTPNRVIGEMFRVLAPSGTLFVRDLLRPDDDSRVTNLVDTYAGRATGCQRAMYAASLRAALTVEEVRAIATTIGIPADAVTQTSDRHWTCSYQKPARPAGASAL